MKSYQLLEFQELIRTFSGLTPNLAYVTAGREVVLGQWQLCVRVFNNLHISEPELSSESKGKHMLLSSRLKLLIHEAGLRYNWTLLFSLPSYRCPALNALYFFHAFIERHWHWFSLYGVKWGKTCNNKCRSTCKGVYVAQFDVTDIFLEGVREITKSLRISGVRA
jgi:hypothetical protein